MPLDHPAFALATRAVLVSCFLFSGLTKALDFNGTRAEVQLLTGLRHTTALTVVVIIVQLTGSALVVAGEHLPWFGAWIGAGLLAGFTLVTNVAAHAFWRRTGRDRIREATTFLEHLGLLAGLVLVLRLLETD